jgi:hypothetical protein
MNDFRIVERLLDEYKKPFAIDTSDRALKHLILKSDVDDEGVALAKAFHGYIVLNRDEDYTQSSLIPGFYDDEFTKKIWDELRSQGKLKDLPKKWKRKTPTGEDFMEMLDEGLR